uniref:Uncharacterized protein n=1 Tax=Glossina austeni TaxID=7395 RepID=A0A1A9UEA9_GLOAU
MLFFVEIIEFSQLNKRPFAFRLATIKATVLNKYEHNPNISKSKSFNSVSNSASSPIHSRSPPLRQKLRVEARLQADHNPTNNLNQSDEIDAQLRNECVCYQQLNSNPDSQEYQSLQSLEEYMSLPSTIPTIIRTDNHSHYSNSDNNNAQANTSSALNSRLGESLTCYASTSSKILIVLKSPTNIRTSSSLQISENCPCMDDTCDSLMNASPLDELPLNFCEKCSNYDLLTDDTRKICLHINKIFSEHLQDVNNDAKNESEQKRASFENSVDANLERLEAELTERLERLRRKIKIDHRPDKKDDMLNFRKNFHSFIRVAYHEEKFDVQDLSFEGKSHKRVYDLIDASMQTNSQSQMYVLSDSWIHERPHSRTFDVNDAKIENLKVNNGKADIKLDVAPVKTSRKQDEIEELKKQLARMEMEMQQKFQQNNELVQELRDDLNSAVFKVTKYQFSLTLLTLVSYPCGDINGHSMTMGSVTKETSMFKYILMRRDVSKLNLISQNVFK